METRRRATVCCRHVQQSQRSQEPTLSTPSREGSAHAGVCSVTSPKWTNHSRASQLLFSWLGNTRVEALQEKGSAPERAVQTVC